MVRCSVGSSKQTSFGLMTALWTLRGEARENYISTCERKEGLLAVAVILMRRARRPERRRLKGEQVGGRGLPRVFFSQKRGPPRPGVGWQRRKQRGESIASRGAKKSQTDRRKPGSAGALREKTGGVGSETGEGACKGFARGAKKAPMRELKGVLSRDRNQGVKVWGRCLCP